jgi:predicted permease
VLTGLFLNNLLPVFLAAAAGYPLGRWLKVNPRSLSQVIFYIFSPCLVFTLITDNQLGGVDLLRMVGFVLLLTLLVGLAALVAGAVLRINRSLLAATLLVTMFMNAGNLGLPVNLFSFGDPGLAQASLFFITNILLTYTVGIFIASLGSSWMHSPDTTWISRVRTSLLGLLRIPTVYALVLAVLFNNLGWVLPLPLDRTVRLLSSAAIPSMLVLMGLQLQHFSLSGNRGAIAAATTIRLLLAPALAFVLALIFNMQGPARQAGILEAAMPSAVLSTVLATEYDTQPGFVTTVVLITTLLSPLTMTPLIAYLSR